MYSDYAAPVSQKPRRKLWLTIIIVLVILIVAAGVGFLVAMGTERINEQQAVKDELVTQNTRLRLSIKDGALAPDSVATVQPTDTVTVRIVVANDLKAYCIDAQSKKSGSDIAYHMYKDTPEVEPIDGLCGENATEKPATPQGVTLGSTSAHSISFVWQPQVTASSYRLQCTLSAGSSTPITSTARSAQGNVAGLTAGGTYACRVAAENSAGLSDWSEPVVASTVAALLIPEGLKLTAKSTTQIDYSWKPVSGAVEYILEYATDPAFTKDVKQVRTTSQSGSVTGLKGFTPYFFHVKAVTPTTAANQAPFSIVVQGRTNE